MGLKMGMMGNSHLAKNHEERSEIEKEDAGETTYTELSVKKKQASRRRNRSSLHKK